MQEKISLAGDLGSGKSTVSKILTDKLGMEYYSTGTICRQVAARHNMTVVEMNRHMETHPELDREIDDGLIALSDVDKPLLIDSRMAFHFVRGTFRVYLTTASAVSAARIYAAAREEERFASAEETEKKIKERRESEKKRYLSFYGVDIKDMTNYDLILDTTYISPEEVANEMASAFSAWKNDKTKKACLLSPLRLQYSEDALPDGQAVSSLAEEIEGGARPLVPVFMQGDDFCVKGDPTAALAYSLAGTSLVPCLLQKEKEGGKFVSMSQSL